MFLLDRIRIEFEKKKRNTKTSVETKVTISGESSLPSSSFYISIPFAKQSKTTRNERESTSWV